jgi:hypothetical protein
MNFPSTAEGNWDGATTGVLTEELRDIRLKTLTYIYGRTPCVLN